MSPRSDQSGDETYREEEAKDRGRFPYHVSRRWAGTWGVWPFTTSRAEETGYDEGAYEGAPESPHGDDDSESRWDEGLITLLIVGGAVLFLFPEPITSGLGLLLLSLGVIGWLVDWAL